jgi:hypothetical protein
MRKSGRLASIHEDDADSSGDASKTKKFVPTIPTVRRKKILVVDDEDAEEGDTSSSTSSSSSSQKLPIRQPLNSSRTRSSISTGSVVSGPLSLGPAAMTRPSRTSVASASPIFTARTASRLTVQGNISSSSECAPSDNSIPVQEEFSSLLIQENIGNDEILKPVAISSETTPLPASNITTNFDPTASNNLFLFQMPPILPSLAKFPTEPSIEAEKWPAEAQGRYGRLRRYKSGKMVLVLENGTEFAVNPSVESANCANSSVLAIDPEFAQSFNLGALSGRFVCTPNFNN